MKKFLAILLVLVMLFSLTACGDTTTTETNTDSKVENSETADNSASTENESDDSSKVEEETNTPKVPETWTKDYYVDEFNEPTQDWFISSAFAGTFSNSATNNSNLSGYILIDSVDVTIILYEYNRNQVKNIYSRDEKYSISVKLEDGSKRDFSGSIYSEGDRIVIDKSDIEPMKELLKTGGNLKFYIYETDNSVTNYLFSISSNNLSELLA